MQITGGKVSFKRSYQPEQYGSKGADVEISFMMAEGEELGTKLDDVAKLVKGKVLQLCNIKTETLGNAPADVAKAAFTVETKVEPPKPEVKPKAKTKADLEAEKLAALKAKEPEPKVAPEGEDLGGTFSEEDGEQPEISDTEIVTAINATCERLNPTNGNTTPKLIKALIQTFRPHDLAADATFKSIQIAQKLRRQFLAKLKEMK